MKKLLVFLCGVLFFFGMIINANAMIITETLGEYSSPFHNPGTYTDQYLVGTFTYDLMGEDIISATISGQWGNTDAWTTAHNLLFVDDLEVADTHNYSPDPYYSPNIPWSYTFTDFTVLLDGTADFSTVQTSESVVRLGSTLLTIETSPSTVPIPSTILLLGTGLVGLVGAKRKKFQK